MISPISLFFIFVSFLIVTNIVGHQDFGYFGIHGPSHWGKDYHTCVGKHQSPINIEEHDVKNVSFSSLGFSGLLMPRSTNITNNGHTVMLVMNSTVPARVYGGPLGNFTYIFEQMHFHWGENDNEGSEDLINNHSFAMELHAVFFKEEYKSMTEAVHHNDGLTVLAYFFEADDKTNSLYNSIVSILPHVEAVDSKYQFTHPLQLGDYLHPENLNIQNYFTYNGSLTTPPCAEVVTWIDFKESLKLSHNQIAAFRGIKSTEGRKLTHNFRPVQPLEDRLVYHNVPSSELNNKNNNVHNQMNHEYEYQKHTHSSQCKIVKNQAIILLAISIILKFK